tara:strand:+ start:55 stop:1452 length:1398 start_codon:yes stop_codon:yes gene_type:complete
LNQKKQILVIDDDPAMQSLVKDALSEYRVTCYGSAKDAWTDLIEEDSSLSQETHLILTDLKMPGMNGMELLQSLSQQFPQIPVLLMTAFGSIETAIEATKYGAFHYISKPFSLMELKTLVEKALILSSSDTDQGQGADKAPLFHGMVGNSPVMKSLFESIRQVGPSAATVMIQGESGTGKELIARALHEESARKDHPFVAVNVSALPENLIESELFGYEKGAFTGADQKHMGLFEQARGGTLFLDEIGDLNLPLQAKLLRALQEKKIRSVGGAQEKSIDVRVISATHKDLKKSCLEGTFREDLFYRLAVIPLSVPPLRNRKEDLPQLVDHFIQKFNGTDHKNIQGLSPEAMAKLRDMEFKGNVRELENLLERAVVFCQSDRIESKDLPALKEPSAETLFFEMSQKLPTLEEFERRYIQFVLDKTEGQKDKAAQILNVHRRTLLRKEKDWSDMDASGPSTSLEPAP